MKTIYLHNKEIIESFLRRDIYLHLYSLGDLDDFYWQYTQWFALSENEIILSLVLLYTGLEMPTLLALDSSDNIENLRRLFNSIVHLLPGKFHLHISPGLTDTLSEEYILKPRGEHYKMALKNPQAINKIDTSRVDKLGIDERNNLLKLYKMSYPGHWFDPRMLETGQYYGIRESCELVSVAGIHVFSPEYRVAALGNITTRPDYRGKGYGKAVTAKLCESLLQSVSYIGLNVKSDNMPAIKCYKDLGFEIISSFEEYIVKKIRI